MSIRNKYNHFLFLIKVNINIISISLILYTMSLVAMDSDIQIKTLLSDVNLLKHEITELKKIVLELKVGKKRGPKKRKSILVKDISFLKYSNNKVELLLNNDIIWKTSLSNLDKIIYVLKHNSKYEINSLN